MNTILRRVGAITVAAAAAISFTACDQISSDVRGGASAMGKTLPASSHHALPDLSSTKLGEKAKEWSQKWDAAANSSSSGAQSKLAHGNVTGALSTLNSLSVKGKAPMTGYDRVGKFGPAWKDVDHNGCDTRNDVLKRDLKNVEFKDGTKRCVVASGTLSPEPYTGKTIQFVRGPQSSKVQIDHLVALGNVWVSGGQKLSQSQRESIANDPANLVSADGPANMGKQAKNAAEWLPANKSYRCTYVSGQIRVKAKYGLSVTGAEKAAMKKVLDRC